ncbi:MAG: DUF2809 domain-containing protein [Bacteroidetes bacterium]|nr:DUF2809 domain-containing protein [Bacteroidota bacterium]
MIKKIYWITILSIIFLFFIGIYTKLYIGPADKWVHDSLGGVLYVIFWCLVVYLIPRTQKHPLIIAICVFTITCFLEVLQLWHPPFLESIRKTFFGQAMFGNSFSWIDFPYYILGAVIGYSWMKIIRKMG